MFVGADFSGLESDRGTEGMAATKTTGIRNTVSREFQRHISLKYDFLINTPSTAIRLIPSPANNLN
jgi:hypothetical protein